ncbi:phage gp6-like head-tail connector protein [Planococcus plakortidis]
MPITPTLVEDFKERMHISHSAEDANLNRHLRNAEAAIIRMVGPVDIATNYEAQELVFERARYAYNDSLEYFEDNFVGEITALSLTLLPEVVEDEV